MKAMINPNYPSRALFISILIFLGSYVTKAVRFESIDLSGVTGVSQINKGSDGGDGGSLVIKTGVVAASDGATKNLETSESLESGEYLYRQVCAPASDPGRAVELTISGTVVIHCAGLFAPSRILGEFREGSAIPKLIVYAGAPVRYNASGAPVPGFFEHGQWKKGQNYTVVQLSAKYSLVNLHIPFNGGAFEFYTSAEESIWSGRVVANGANSNLQGIPGAGGSVILASSSSFLYPYAIQANGGQWTYSPFLGFDYNTAGIKGGDGGTIAMEGFDFVDFGSDIPIEAIGGQGSEPPFSISIGARGGDGGNGGKISLVLRGPAEHPFAARFDVSAGGGGNGGLGEPGLAKSQGGPGPGHKGGDGGNGGTAGVLLLPGIQGIAKDGDGGRGGLGGFGGDDPGFSLPILPGGQGGDGGDGGDAGGQSGIPGLGGIGGKGGQGRPPGSDGNPGKPGSISTDPNIPGVSVVIQVPSSYKDRTIRNVGEFAIFEALVTGAKALTYKWEVSGPILKDYEESTTPGSHFTVQEMVPGDFTSQTISFYWLPVNSQRFPSNTGPVKNQISVRVMTDKGEVKASIEKLIERNEVDVTRQPVAFYTANHLVGRTSKSPKVLVDHAAYHAGTLVTFGNGSISSWSFDGSSFFQFHSEFLNRYERWRETFGYGPLVTWNPSDPLPSDWEAQDSTFPGSYVPQPLPSWFTVAGGTKHRPKLWDSFPDLLSWFMSSYNRGCVNLGGEVKLADFADTDALGCALIIPYHGDVHAAVGGRMGPVASSPSTELFWRFHKFLSGIAFDYIRVKSPMVITRVPAGYQRALTTPPSVIQITMSKPITGVEARYLKVNGSPAKIVAGEGEGPYQFSGFDVPHFGRLEIAFDLPENLLNGVEAKLYEWSHELLHPQEDADGDGLSNEEELAIGTNPLIPDSDGDGISDNEEIVNGDDPLSPTASLRITKTENSELELRWPLLRQDMHLQKANSILGPWSDVTGHIENTLNTSLLVVKQSEKPEFFKLSGTGPLQSASLELMEIWCGTKQTKVSPPLDR